MTTDKEKKPRRKLTILEGVILFIIFFTAGVALGPLLVDSAVSSFCAGDI